MIGQYSKREPQKLEMLKFKTKKVKTASINANENLNIETATKINL